MADGEWGDPVARRLEQIYARILTFILTEKTVGEFNGVIAMYSAAEMRARVGQSENAWTISACTGNGRRRRCGSGLKCTAVYMMGLG